MLKLNIGAGENPKPAEEHWVNIDIRNLPDVQLVRDMEVHDLPYHAGSVDHIQLQDFLEHLSKERQKSFVRHVYDVLKPLGTVYIQLPDLEVLAKRYCGVLENPTEMQHPLNGEQLAAALYGGQEYLYNCHKWGYDSTSLQSLLENVGFSVRSIGTDGGQNLLCTATKPTSMVYLPLGGGLGDILQVYLADPLHDEDGGNEEGSVFGSSDPITSMWFRRLHSLKQRFPLQKVRVIVGSHNPFAKDLFEYHPCIDDVIAVPWTLPTDGSGREDTWNDAIGSGENVYKVYEQKFFGKFPPVVYMSEEEKVLVNRIKSKGKYIVIHPFAGNSLRACSAKCFNLTTIK